MGGTGAPIGSEKTATTVFSEGGVGVKSDYSHPILTDNFSVEMMSIKDFLEKPQRVGTYTWSTTQLANANLASGYVETILMGNTYWANKLEGFNLLRGTVCFRVELSCNPFQQGKLLFHFIPNEAEISANDLSFAAMHNLSLDMKRQHPCVEIDARESVGAFEMPYVSPYNWYSKKTGTGTWGKFQLDVLSSLATGTGGDTSVDVTIYMYFRDFECAAPMVPQSGKGPKSKFKGKTWHRDTASKELEAMKSGTISSALKVGSQVSTALGAIPMLAPVAQPAAWVLDIASGVASSLGWSKPVDNIPPTIASLQYQRYGATSDGVNSAMPLALRSDNKISVTDKMTVYDGDEMSFSFLKKVSTVLSEHTWSETQISGTSLYTKQVYPGNLYNQYVKSAGATSVYYNVGSPTYYLSNYFKLWRGSIMLTVKIVKTDYHTGRLQLTWTPSTTTTAAPNLATGQLALREIIDISEGNEFTFCLPYYLNSHYVGRDIASGSVDIVVLNELRGPETASSTVSLLMYYSGGDDLEFQMPCYDAASPYKLIFSPQTGGDDVITNSTPGDCCINMLDTRFASDVNGEMFTSVKQILSRNTFVPTTNRSGFAADNVIMWPWVQGVLSLAPAGTMTVPNIGGDAYSAIAAMYVYFRGSVNLTYHAGSGSTFSNTLVVTDPMFDNYNCFTAGKSTLGNYSNSPWYTGTSNTGFGGYAIAQAGFGMSSVAVPYHGRTKCSFSMRCTNSNNIPTDPTQPLTSVNTISVGAGAVVAPFRSFGDEFQLSYFIGAPPVYVRTV